MKKNFLALEIQFINLLQAADKAVFLYKKTSSKLDVKCAIRGSNPGHPD